MVLPAVFRFQRFFAKLPDQNIGGEFAVRVAAGSKISHRYLPKTNILVTSFQRGNDQFELIDFMPRYNRDSGAYRCPRILSAIFDTYPASPSYGSTITRGPAID